MHLHKLQYYLGSSRGLKAFFVDFVETKLQYINNIFDKAGENIQRYNDNVRIANNSLTKTWYEQHGRINAAQNEALANLEEPDPIPAKPSDISSVKDVSAAFEQDLSRHLATISEQLSERLKEEAARRIDSHVRETADRIGESAPDELDASAWRVSSLPLAATLDHLAALPLWFVERAWAARRGGELGAIREIATKIRRIVGESVKLMEARAPFSQCEKEVLSAPKLFEE